APGLAGSVEILGRRFPEYDLFLIAVGPAVLGALWLLLTRTRWGTLVRAATQDREMVAALGVNQVWLFTSVFALGAMLAGLGRAQALSRYTSAAESPLRRAEKPLLLAAAVLAVALVALPLLASGSPYVTVLAIDLMIAALFAASLHFIMGPAGMHSFGHAAYFGLGAYGAALLVRSVGLPMEGALIVAPLVAALGALVFGWFCVRLSGVYLAMLTLAFAQITWAV